MNTDRRLVTITLGVALVASAAPQLAWSRPPASVTICHKNRRTLTVGAPAARAHIRHGDALGPCAPPSEEQAKQGSYEVDINWELTSGGTDVRIVKIAERALGDVIIFREPGKDLEIHPRLLSPGVVEYRLENVPLIVEDEKPFSIAAFAVGVGSTNTPGAINKVSETCGHTDSLNGNQQLLLFNTVVIQTIPEIFESGVLRVTYSCETCSHNPCTIGLD